MTTALFILSVLLIFSGAGIHRLQIVPALRRHDPNRNWGSNHREIRSELDLYARLCVSEGISRFWHHACLGSWISGLILLIVAVVADALLDAA